MAYTVVMDVTSITVTVFKVEKLLKHCVTIPGNSVNINIDCLASSDRLEYNHIFESYH